MLPESCRPIDGNMRGNKALGEENWQAAPGAPPMARCRKPLRPQYGKLQPMPRKISQPVTLITARAVESEIAAEATPSPVLTRWAKR